MLEAVSMFFNCNTSTNTINCQCLHDRFDMQNRYYVYRVALLPYVKLWSVGAVMCRSDRSNFFGLVLLLAAQYERIFRSAIQQIIKYDQLKFKLGDNMRALMMAIEALLRLPGSEEKRCCLNTAKRRWSSMTENCINRLATKCLASELFSNSDSRNGGRVQGVSIHMIHDQMLHVFLWETMMCSLVRRHSAKYIDLAKDRIILMPLAWCSASWFTIFFYLLKTLCTSFAT